ncbi:MAG: DNA primase [Elusimicrobiota bacterium]
MPENTIEKVNRANDIVDLISEYFPLKRSGSNYKALCPFHQEKTPSFVVSRDKQLFHCFGCGESGNIFNFVMKMEGLDFSQSLRRLAERANIDITGGSSDYERTRQIRDNILEINARAAEFYNKVLFSKEGYKALEYLRDRGLDNKIINKFKLGYAPGGSFLTKHALENGLNEDVLIKASLSDKNRRGSLYDKFRERIMFPIFDERGKVRGFGGRVLRDSAKPKYLNTARTDVFEKKQIIYGLFQAKKAVRTKKRIILLEGYMDVIAAHQYGLKEAVAALGTAITSEHVYKIKHWVSEAIISFDSDKSGIKAAQKGVDMLESSAINSKVCSLPSETDPEDIIRRNFDEFLKYLRRAEDGIEWRIKNSIKNFGGIDTPDKKASIVADIIPLIKGIENRVKRSEVIKQISEVLSINESAVMGELARFKNKRDSILKKKMTSNKLTREEKIFRELLHVILRKPDLKKMAEPVLKFKFDNLYFKLLEEFVRNSNEEMQESLYRDKEKRNIVSKLSLMPLNHDRSAEIYLKELISALEFSLMKSKYERLSKELIQLRSNNDYESLKKKNKEFRKLAEQLKGSKKKTTMNNFNGRLQN